MLSSQHPEAKIEYISEYLQTSGFATITDEKGNPAAELCIMEQRAHQDTGTIFKINGLKDIPESALKETAKEMNEKDANYDFHGSTACLVVAQRDGNTVRVKTMSAGDSFAELYIFNANGSVALHKILNTAHKGRVPAGDGGILQISRAFGDFAAIEYGFSNEPEIKKFEAEVPDGGYAKVFIYSDAFEYLAKQVVQQLGIACEIVRKIAFKKSESTPMTQHLVELASPICHKDDTTAIELNINSINWIGGAVFDGHGGHSASYALAENCVERLKNAINKSLTLESSLPTPISSTALAFEILKIDPTSKPIVSIAEPEPTPAPAVSQPAQPVQFHEEPEADRCCLIM